MITTPTEPALLARLLTLVAAIGLGLVGCDGRQPATTTTTSAATSPAGLRTVDVRVGTKTFTLEVADTSTSRTRGLMRRDSMPRDHGMLFVFPAEDERGFWMKDTRIPLDIVFLDAGGRVVSVHQMKPYDVKNTTYSAGPAKYAIELNQGVAAEAGVKPGDVVEIPPDARDAKE
jgi:uncharacterized membrane protein (UPF0127 family)